MDHLSHSVESIICLWVLKEEKSRREAFARSNVLTCRVDCSVVEEISQREERMKK